MTMTPAQSHASRLLEWYDRHRRTLPWRAPAGRTSAPYIVWLSEIMLQQTTVATVGDYFHRFVKRWPSVEALAGAPIDEVLSAWAGLGFFFYAATESSKRELLALRGPQRVAPQRDSRSRRARCSPLFRFSWRVAGTPKN